MANWQAHLIKEIRPIRHGWWAALSGLLIAGATWCASPDPWWPMVDFVVAQCASRLAAFNFFLYLFRGLPWNYVSPTSTSILDRLEYRLFGTKAWVIEVLLGASYITYQFTL
jgi:hypothetical protein